MTSSHIPKDRLRSFMLGCDDLEEAEHAHIIRCALCAQKMAESVLEEMEDHPPMTKEKAQSSTSSE